MARPTDLDMLNLAKETGYSAYGIERMIRLFDILQAIERDGFLRERVALTGGTALNAFHIGLKRLSMDIDLKYIGRIDEDAALAERNDVDGALLRILNDEGHSIKKQKIRSNISQWDTRFESSFEGMSRLHIDLGYVERRPLFGVSRMPSVELCGVRATDILVFDREDVIAGKLAALTQRAAARDLFDALSIADIEGLDMESVRAAYIASIAASPGEWRDCRLGNPKADPHKECQKFGGCVPRGYFRNKVAAVAWYNESVRICRERFGCLLELTHQERMFVDGVHNRGEVRADLLSAPPELRARIEASTQLAWKCRIVRENRKSQDVAAPERDAGR